MKKMSLFIRIMFYGLILSTLIGIISFLFILLESNLSHYIWGTFLKQGPFKHLFTLIFCILGGVIVGKLRSKWGDFPQTAHYTLSKLKKYQTVNYQPVFKNLFIAFIILIFGAGVGPEAALLSAVLMLSIWQADKLRYLVVNQKEFMALTPINRVIHMLHPTRYLVTYKTITPPTNPKFIATKKAVNLLFILNGLVSFIVLMKLTNQPSFISKMGESTSWQLKDLWYFIPLIILGTLSGILYNILKKNMRQWFNFWSNQPIKKALIGSMTIFMIGTFFPNLLFSGQVTLGSVPNEYLNFSALVLFVIVGIKLIFLQICLNTGWIGGDIFPIVFASIIQGFAFSQLFPSVDVIFLVAIVATSMAITILQSPIGVALFISLFFPINILPVILSTAFLSKLILLHPRMKYQN